MGLLGGDGMVANLHPPKRGPLCPCRFPLSACGDLSAIRLSALRSRAPAGAVRHDGPGVRRFQARRRRLADGRSDMAHLDVVGRQRDPECTMPKGIWAGETEAIVGARNVDEGR